MTEVFGINFDRRPLNALADLLTDPVTHDGVRLVCTANVDHIVNLRDNPSFRQAYAEAYIVTADGAPIYAYVNLRGGRLAEKVTGSALFPAIMHRMDPLVHRPAFLAAKQETALFIEASLLAKGFTDEQFFVSVPPFGFEGDERKTQELIEQISAVGATLLVMGVGSPKSEVWVERNRARLGNLYALGVGIGMDYFAGTARRAPSVLQMMGLEWSWRLLSEPRRLARRYLVNSWRFLAAIADDLGRGRRL